MHERYGIVTRRAFGVPMGAMLKLAKPLGRDHALAQALWKTGWYEARTVAALVDEPERVTPAQMDRWCRDFDNWALCDTVCFKLFDRVPHATGCIPRWARSSDEFVKRAAFALLACVALHAHDVADAELVALLPLVERAADDDRNFVRKGVLWALRGVGSRAGARREALAVARRLSASATTSARWIGRSAERAFAKSTPKRDATRPSKKA
ncbi:MAG: DNA alkylation repair protein [Planctomycetes bacterium]|nr:DNA alkylation repair protein [Planctomycetota bacterium]